MHNGNGNWKKVPYEEVSLINVEGTGEQRLAERFHEFFKKKVRKFNFKETEITYEEVSLINVDRTGELRLFAHRLAEDHDLFK